MKGGIRVEKIHVHVLLMLRDFADIHHCCSMYASWSSLIWETIKRNLFKKEKETLGIASSESSRLIHLRRNLAVLECQDAGKHCAAFAVVPSARVSK